MPRIAFIASARGPSGAPKRPRPPPGAVAGLAADAGAAGNDNCQRLPAAFAAAGWKVSLCGWETLQLTSDGVGAEERCGATLPLAAFDLIWLVGMGAREGFLDRVQMLRTLPQERFVNTPDALAFLHGKLALLELAPETHVSAHAADLLRILARGGRWVAKPVAGSFGRDVHLLCGHGPDTRAVLERLAAGGHCILQRYAPQAETAEKRVLVAAGAIVGAYAKTGGNLTAGGAARRTALNDKECALALQVAKRLQEQGARFAGIDLAWPHVFEANIANPGGLRTLERLTGRNLAPAVVSALTKDGFGAQRRVDGD